MDHADLALQVRTDQLGAAALDGEARVYRYLNSVLPSIHVSLRP